jgi:hypothetical protein
MQKSAYIKTPPKSIKFSLPYSDGSGERLVVSIDSKMKDVRIATIDSMLIEVEDIQWLRQALDDIDEVVKMNDDTIKTAKPENS